MNLSGQKWRNCGGKLGFIQAKTLASRETRKREELVIDGMNRKTLSWPKLALFFFLAAFGLKRPIFNEARKAARRTGKPLLNAGCNTAYTEESDVNLDLVPRKAPRFIRGDIQDLYIFRDKQFGAAYASHVLEHVEHPEIALRELHRVADNVFVITPLPLWPWAWLYPGHKWVLWGTKTICQVPSFLQVMMNLLVTR